MIAVDTNILVRLLVRDDEAQFESAFAMFRDNAVYLPDSVILETEWVLRFAYELPRDAVCSAFKRTLGLKNVVVDDPVLMAKAIAWHESGMDFADALHLSKCERLPALKTFDKTFIRQARGKSPCKVSMP